MARRSGIGAIAGVIALLAQTAGATSFYDLTVVSSQSYLDLLPGSALVVNPGAPIGVVSAALESPSGAGSAIGLRGALQGNLRVRYETALVFPQVDVIPSATLVGFAEAGAFAPGLPGSQGTPAPAGWAITFGANALGIAGDVAVRGLALTLLGGGRVSSVGPNAFVFPDIIPPPPAPQPAFTFSIAGGFFDLATSFSSDERFVLGESAFQAPIDPANRPGFEVFGTDLARMTIPVRASIVVTAADLGSPLPFELRLEVGGRIVAQNFPIPEPGSGLLVAAGLIAMAHRRVRPEGRIHA